VVQHVSGACTPIIRSIQLNQQPLVLRLERGGSTVVGRGLAGITDAQTDRETDRQDEADSDCSQFLRKRLKTLQSSQQLLSHIGAAPSELPPLFPATNTSSTAAFLCEHHITRGHVS
jgi:hypothetical protein